MVRRINYKKACVVLVICATAAIGAPAQVYTTLLEFDGSNGNVPYQMSLAQGFDGNLYGTTMGGGANLKGTVFKITRGGALTTLYSFCDNRHCVHGEGPEDGLALGTDGNFYGTTPGGGSDGDGTVFRITAGGKLITLHSFDLADGGNANSILQSVNGSLFGTTSLGGAKNGGTVFRLTPDATFTTLHSFAVDTFPNGMVQATDGNFYGTTDEGGANCRNAGGCGTIFRMTPSGALTTLYRFCAQDGCTDGSLPAFGLIQASDGNFYGSTLLMGENGGGTIFKISSGGQLTTLYNFCAQPSCTDGDDPVGPLVQATDGNFYGTTESGGDIACNPPSGCGTIFQITPGGTLTTLHNFESFDGANGGGLLQATDGLLYGTSSGGILEPPECGPPYGCGVVFSLDMGLGPFVTFVRAAGKVGQTGPILGQGLTGTTSVTLNGTPARFTVVSDTLIKATVPAGATTGYVTVTTPGGTLTSNVPFHVIK